MLRVMLDLLLRKRIIGNNLSLGIIRDKLRIRILRILLRIGMILNGRHLRLLGGGGVNKHTNHGRIRRVICLGQTFEKCATREFFEGEACARRKVYIIEIYEERKAKGN